MRVLLIVLACILVILVATPALSQAQQGPQPQVRTYLPLRLIVLKYADPADIAFLFGGTVIQGGGMYGGGGGGYGGNSGSSGYGGNSGYGGGSGYGNSGSSGYGGNSGSSNYGGSGGRRQRW